MVELLRTYSDENASEVKDDAKNCVVSLLGRPNVLIVDFLLALPPVAALKGEPIYQVHCIGRLYYRMVCYATYKCKWVQIQMQAQMQVVFLHNVNYAYSSARNAMHECVFGKNFQGSREVMLCLLPFVFAPVFTLVKCETQEKWIFLHFKCICACTCIILHRCLHCTCKPWSLMVVNWCNINRLKHLKVFSVYLVLYLFS